MRENRLSGSEGGGLESNRLSLPLSLTVDLINHLTVFLIDYTALHF